MAVADLSDVRCYYKLLGQGDPLLLIPGLGVTSRIWDTVVPELAEHFSLILVDNRGVGLSEANLLSSQRNVSGVCLAAMICYYLDF